MNTLLLYKVRKGKAADRKYRPSAVALEERCTPTVNTLAVFGMTPTVGGAGSVTIGGLISESNTIAASTLAVSYQMTDSQGNVLASGPLTVKSVLPNSQLLGVSTTVHVTLARGSTETITLTATDVDTVGVPLAATASLYVSPTRGVNTLGLGVIESNGDIYTGSGIGHVTVTQQAGGGFLAKGTGTIHVASDPNNNNLLNATATGAFTFGVGPLGNLGLNVTHGTGTFNYGTFAGDTTATGGFSATLAGNLSLTRYADASISATAKGTIAIKAQIASTSTTNPTPTTMTGRGCNVAIALQTDTAGHFKLGLSGKMKLSGYLNTSGTGVLV